MKRKDFENSDPKISYFRRSKKIICPINSAVPFHYRGHTTEHCSVGIGILLQAVHTLRGYALNACFPPRSFFRLASSNRVSAEQKVLEKEDAILCGIIGFLVCVRATGDRVVSS